MLKKFLVFALFALALNGLVFGIMYLKYYRMYRHFPEKEKYRGLILADSHGLCLGNEPEKDGFFNFSAESDNYSDMYIKLRYFLRKYPGTRIVLISADDHTLSVYREQLNNRDRNVIYRSFFGETESGGLKAGYAFIKDFIRYYLVILNPSAADISKRFLAGKLRPGNQDAALPDWSDPEQKQAMAEARFQSQFPGRDKSELLEQELRSIFHYCRKAGVAVYGLRFPLSPLYSGMVKGNGYGADRILKENRIPVLSFTDSIPDAEGIFENQDHLSLKGGLKLAALLRRSKEIR